MKFYFGLAVAWVWFTLLTTVGDGFYYRDFREACAAQGGWTLSSFGSRPWCFRQDAHIDVSGYDK